jgi:BON domain
MVGLRRDRPRSARNVSAAVLAGILPLVGPGAVAQALHNWFDDPFFRISSAIADCPEPAGPRVTEAERQVQSHRRAEKGTTCWLAKECDRPNAYAYDRDIAEGIRSAFRRHAAFPDTSLWVTVQGRIVYVEGCVARESQAAEIEAFIREVAHVQQSIAIVTTHPNTPPPYRRFLAR